MIGSFLPWLRSGLTLRNSYRAGGVAERLLDLAGPARLALSVWPFVSLACAATIAVYVFGLNRTGHLLALALGVVTGLVAVAALSASGSGSIAIQRTGPALTLIGACLAVLPVMLQYIMPLFASRRSE